MTVLVRLFIAFLKIGFLGFGGGYAMLSLIYDESLILGLTHMQFADLNALDMIVPGPISVNAATYVGYLVSTHAGAIVATLAVAIPSFVYVFSYLKVEEKMKDNIYFDSFIKTVKVASAGIILAAAFNIVRDQYYDAPEHWLFITSVIVASLYLQLKKEVNPIYLTIASGVAGALIYFIV
jgi:chromate transporter